MPEPPQLTPFDVEEQRLYSEFPPDGRAPHPISNWALTPKATCATAATSSHSFSNHAGEDERPAGLATRCERRDES